tara:strand:- start:27 stop:281 length:255 start_codon:yes stop_codon:yes gene_type:complete
MEEATVTFRIKVKKGMEDLYPNYLSNEMRHYKVKEMCNYYNTTAPGMEEESAGFLESLIASMQTPHDAGFLYKNGYEIKLIKIK